MAEIQELLRRYDEGTQSRVVFRTAHRLAVSGLDAYRRRYRQPERRLIEVDLCSGQTPPSPNSAVAVVLGSGLRIQFAWVELAEGLHTAIGRGRCLPCSKRRNLIDLLLMQPLSRGERNGQR